MSIAVKKRIIGIDFDGTVVEHVYPAVGADIPHAERVIRSLSEVGHRLVLWTMRSFDSPNADESQSSLQDALDWYAHAGIPLAAINTNVPGGDFSTSRKVYCHTYIDDAALGCPLRLGIEGGRPMVDWLEVERQLKIQGFLPLS